MLAELSGKTALVTGAASGIGQGLASPASVTGAGADTGIVSANVAKILVFLCSDTARVINGAGIAAAAGLHATINCNEYAI